MTATTYTNRQWIYARQPTGRVGADHYTLRETPIDDRLAEGEVLLGARYLSVDPYMRVQQHTRRTYDAPHPLGIVQQGGAVSQVLASSSAALRPGDWVLGYNGWQTHDKCHASQLHKLDPAAAPVTSALGVLGMPGRTAWFGLMEAGRPRPGDTLVVSGAAGAVGSLVAQFGKRAGCRVIGIAGGPAKCAWLTGRLGLDGAVDYKAFASTEALAAEVARQSGGVDIYFDNVGGAVSDAVIPLIKLRARIVVCGTISQYEGGIDAPELAPRVLQHLLFQRATAQGILARDFVHRMDELRTVVAPWVRSGEVFLDETVVEGFERLPHALNMLFEGANTGKLLVKVA
ncbi:NADP-dependent oxidoreductase [Massilia forsythiae]|uniref:NADP-dependent oxidoreductase n=1 Tax=Massilia forsythiae TaxID=2728020 RepID=A0A7Z2VZ82_9BURK|nr:NADP-dependent oxidoreductase [Massilia forsythiae]QJE01878.1 NADP-dependent oxidoreductase [Massilia forsythiae]